MYVAGSQCGRGLEEVELDGHVFLDDKGSYVKGALCMKVVVCIGLVLGAFGCAFNHYDKSH